jgi:two-component system chemotaxis sensor kinase CheA
MTIDMSQFYQVFFEEAGEHLANMESLLLALDTDNPSLDDLNAIFRAAHSIKGGSGTFGFTDMTEVTHILETLLDRLRKSELALRPEMVDAFLAAGDVLRGQLEHHQGGPEVDRGQIDEICARLAALASDAPATAPSSPATPAPAARVLILECVLPDAAVADAQGMDGLLAGLAELGECELRHRPTHEDARLVARLNTARADADIRELFAFHLAPDEISLHPDSAGEDEAFGIFDSAPGAPDPGYGLFADVPEAAPAPNSDEAYGFFTEATPPAASRQDESWGLFSETPAAAAAPSAEDSAGYGFFPDTPGSPLVKAPAAEEGVGYGIFTGAPGASPAPAAPAPASAPTTPASPGRRASDDPNIERVATGRRGTDKVAVSTSSEASSIRVAVEKVDQLINLVGELVITQAMIADAAGYLDPVQAEKLLSGIDLLSRNTRDLQESVMSIRMLPMSMVFSRFPRVVRDLAGKLNKQIELKTFGESTELDKSLIEKITDPLTHLIRNSLDHGIETPEKRIAAGKSPKGTVTLKASHQGGNIVIEVMDDGAGLNREKLLAKAKERGLSVSDSMPDSEVWLLIFAPGFSTADVVTDVSGRGVGMDVVKKNIEGLGGRVELESSAGLGTRTIIRLPLTLAILDGMSVGVEGETFIVPLTTIVESLQPRTEDIRTMAGDSRVVHIRGEYLPIVVLSEVFGGPGKDALEQGIFVVVESESGKAALFVDELLGQHQVVIKSLEANYRKVPGTSGATIMGDGSVALILDVAAVMRMGLKGAGERRALGPALPRLSAAPA